MADTVKAELIRWLDLYPASTKRAMKIVSAEDIDQPFVLRIDIEPPSRFLPRLPDSVMAGECRTVPRVSSCSHLFGCLYGYGRYQYDVMDGSDKDISAFNGYKGGYILSAFDFDYGILPGPSLVPETVKTEEIWLVNFNKVHAVYKARQIGKLFITEYSLIPSTGKYPTEMVILFLEHNQPGGISVHGKEKIPPGYYRVQYERLYTGKSHRYSYDLDVKVTPLSEKDYLAAKKQQAALLSYEGLPVCLRD